MREDLLGRDVKLLDDILGGMVTEQAGEPARQLIDSIRRLALERRQGKPEAEKQLAALISGLGDDECRVVLRSFSIFFDMSNLAEDLQRVRVLRSREAQAYPGSIGESIGAGIAKLKAADFSPQQVQAALDQLGIELVFTAHPSEAKRRSTRSKLRRMRTCLQELDRTDLLPREREQLESRLRTELSILWQTDFVRPWRPTVREEVERGLSITPRLWEVVPRVYESMRRALETSYPGFAFRMPTFLRFGSWMGGDRDGNPNVTAPITADTIEWLRDTAVERHIAMCKQTYDFLTMALKEPREEDPLEKIMTAAGQRFGGLPAFLASVAPNEIYRRYVKMIEWRLQQSLGAKVYSPLKQGAYRDGAELASDIEHLYSELSKRNGLGKVAQEVSKWYDLARAFGLHLTRLDVRQDSRRHREVLTEIFAQLRLAENYAELPESEKQSLLTRTMSWQPAIREHTLSAMARETLELFRVLRAGLRSFGPDAFGGHVISLTHEPSDVLAVLWLWQWSAAEVLPEESESDLDTAELRIVPLFEQIGDLKNAAKMLDVLLSHPAYAKHLAKMGNRQLIMVGYSDSTKDGGYLAACWGLYRAQSDLHLAADKFGVKLTFFHGRGGSLGRGGGPAARGILSLPPAALDGTLRLTEQGEVLAERYDDVQIAYRHLEQVTWATLVGSALPAPPVTPAWQEIIDGLAKRSFTAYRELVDLPGFIQFFAEATPIEEIENLPIASRPARRRGERTLADLRAIPWVFSWTQNRCMIPAWYGMGTALAELAERDPAAWQQMKAMYAEWPFLQATIDNAALALAKADMYIAGKYAELSEDSDAQRRLWSLIAGERDRTRKMILDLVDGDELLSNTPWLQSSINKRNPHIDPLNLIQVELLRRKRKAQAAGDEAEHERLRALLRLTVQGVAAGMRTTG